VVRILHRSGFVLLVAILLATFTTPSRAQTLAVPGSVNGSLDSGHTKDTYSLTVPADGNVTFTLTTSSTLNGLMRFYDSDGTTQINYVYCNYGSSASLTIPHLGPGATYYASVEINGGSGSYTLSDTETQPPYAKNTEPNNTPAQGIPLTVKGTATGHVGYSTTSYNTQDNIDYYKFTVSADGDVTFSLTTDSTLNALLRFRDSDGTTQINYVYCNYGSSATLTIPHLAPGATYYVSVTVNGGYGSYKAGGSIAVPKESAAREPNNTYQQAQPFALNSSVTGNIGYSTTSYNATDNIDFWKVTVTKAGTLTVKLTTDSTLNGLVRIYSTDGTTQLTYFYTNYGSTASISYALPAAGTYYVSVAVNGGYGGYTLSNTF
jgi:hypothetical protein